MNKLTKRKLAAYLAVEQGLSEEKAMEIVNSVVQLSRESLLRGESITFTGFGSLIPRICKAGKGGFAKKYTIPERMKIKFVISKAFKEELNGSKTKTKAQLKEALKRAAMDDE